jgi:hypothetical protein
VNQIKEHLSVVEDDTEIKMFFKCINLCHECVTIESKTCKGRTDFSGPSTDEICFLEMARTVADFGYFTSRDT